MLRGNIILDKAVRVNIRVKFTTTSYFLPNHANHFSSVSKGNGEGSGEKGKSLDLPLEVILDELDGFKKKSEAEKANTCFNMLIQRYTNTDCEMALMSQKHRFESIMDQMRCAHAREIAERNQRHVIELFFLDVVAKLQSITNVQDKNSTARAEAEALIKKIQIHLGEEKYDSLLRPHPPLSTINHLMTSPLGPYFMRKLGYPTVKFPWLDAKRFMYGELSEEAAHRLYITEVPLPVNAHRDIVAFYEAIASRRDCSLVRYSDMEADNGERHLSMIDRPSLMTRQLLKPFCDDALVGSTQAS